jgi:MFS family permease
MSAWMARNRFLLGFVILNSVAGTSIGLAKVTTPLYGLSIGASQAQVGLVASAGAVGVLLMGVPLGVLVDHFGPARLFAFGTICAGLLYAALPRLPWFPWLLGCSLAIGLFMPFRFVSLNTVFMARLLEIGEDKAGVFRASHLAGMFLIGPTLAGLTLEPLGYAGSYTLIATSFALTLFVSPVVFRSVQHERRALARFDIATLLGRPLSSLLTERDLAAACTGEFALQSINAYYGVFIVVLAATTRGLTAADAPRLVSLQGLSYVGALLGSGRLLAKLGAERSPRLGSAVVAAALVLLGAAPGSTPLWAGAALLGLGLGLLQTVNLTSFARIGARLGRGRVAGLNALAGPAGALFGSSFGGLCAEWFGIRHGFLIFLPALLVLARPSRALSQPPDHATAVHY